MSEINQNENLSTNTRDKVVKNFSWRFLERIGAQGVTFIVEIILARILDPQVYGTLALVTVFTTILQVFVDSGLGNALIQKKDADDLDFSSVFFFNIVACCLLYGLMFLVAPVIASFYEKPELTSVIRVMSLVLVISGVKNVQQAYVSRTMQFKRFFFATLVGTVMAAVVGIWMAHRGYGVWALVTQNLVNLSLDTIILWITIKWRPHFVFSWERLRSLLSYGWKLLVSKLMDTIYTDLRQLFIGKLYSDEDLAFFNKGKRYPHFIVTNINNSIDSVLFPTMSKAQDDVETVKKITRRAIKTSTYLLMPMMMGVAVCAESFVSILLTDKWLPAVPYLRIFCFSYAFYPIHTANLNAIKALGRSDLFLRLNIVKKAVGLALLFATVFVSVKAMAYSLLVSEVLGQIINSWPNRKLLNYSYKDQLKDIFSQMVVTVIMGACVYAVSFLGYGPWLSLAIQIPLGVVIFIGGSVLTKNESFAYLIKIGKDFFRKTIRKGKVENR